MDNGGRDGINISSLPCWLGGGEKLEAVCLSYHST